MFDELVSSMPERWQGMVDLLLVPLAWIPGVQQGILQGTWPDYTFGAAGWETLRLVFLLIPGLVLISGIWITMLSVYTVPFRSNRLHFLGALTMNWWDLLKGFWLYAVGIGRLLLLLVGWVYGMVVLLVKLIVATVRELFMFPFRVGTEVSSKYFQPGVPWIAVLLSVFWFLIEALIFTYMMMPTLYDVISSITGGTTLYFLPPILFVFLFILIAGSFACLHMLTDAIQQRNIKGIIFIAMVELMAMFIEVFFLYRELVDAASPWIYQHTGTALTLTQVLLIAMFGWIGIRGMTWFLFGRYGTPTLIAIISRQRISTGDAAPSVGQPQVPEITYVRSAVDVFKSEVEWFRRGGQELMERAVLPVLQLVAVLVNFVTILLAGETVFRIPFANIEEALDTSELLERLALRRLRADKKESPRS